MLLTNCYKPAEQGSQDREEPPTSQLHEGASPLEFRLHFRVECSTYVLGRLRAKRTANLNPLKRVFNHGGWPHDGRLIASPELELERARSRMPGEETHLGIQM